MRRGSGGLFVAAALALLLAGCAAPGLAGWGAPHPDATPVAAVECPEDPEAGNVEAGAVPAGFAPVALLRCDPYASRDDAEGVYAGALLERFEGDLAPVLAALSTPNDPPAIVCPAIGYLSPELWIEGADGTVVRVAMPSAGCGPKDVGLDAAIATLTRVSEQFVPTVLVESQAATAAGCATQAGLTVVLTAEELPAEYRSDDVEPEDAHLIPDEHLIPWEPPAFPEIDDVTGARVCVYEIGADRGAYGPVTHGSSGFFADAHDLDAAAAAEAMRFIGSATPAASCPPSADAATRLAVVHSLVAGGEGPAVTVELDGCRRISDPGLRTLAAPPELIALLTPAP